jgi:hypothetical protein
MWPAAYWPNLHWSPWHWLDHLVTGPGNVAAADVYTPGAEVIQIDA